MTPEQKFLKALAEWLDIKTCPKNRIQMASREYLDQFREDKSHSIEQLHHFNCSCGQWWTIGDFDNSFEPKCPKCGAAQTKDHITDGSKKVDECVGGCVQCGCCDQFRDDTEKVDK